MNYLITTLFALGLGIAPPTAERTGDAATDTEALFDRAAVQYETSDYVGAVDTYTEAYQLSFSIEDEELRGKVQAAILFNLGRAHSKAYALDQKVEHLRQEIDLLNKYLAQSADLADQMDAETLLRQAEIELRRVEAEAARRAEAEAARRQAEGPQRPESVDVPAKRGMQAAGYTLLGLGVAAGGVAVAGGVLADQAATDYAAGPTRDERDAAADRGGNADIMVIAGSASAGVLITTGIALAIAGRKRSAKKRRAATLTPTGWATPQSSGLGLTGSF